MAQLPTHHDDYIRASATWGEPQDTAVTRSNLKYYPEPGLWVKTEMFPEKTYGMRWLTMQRELKAMAYYRHLQCHTPAYANMLAAETHINAMGDETEDQKRIFIIEHIDGTLLNHFLNDESIDVDVRRREACRYVKKRLPVTVMTANMDDNATNVVIRDTPYAFSGGASADPYTSLDVDKVFQGVPCHNPDYELLDTAYWYDNWGNHRQTEHHTIYMMKRNLFGNTRGRFAPVMNFYFKQYVMAIESGQLTGDDLVQSFQEKMEMMTRNKAEFEPEDYVIMQRRGQAAITYLQTGDLSLG